MILKVKDALWVPSPDLQAQKVSSLPAWGECEVVGLRPALPSHLPLPERWQLLNHHGWGWRGGAQGPKEKADGELGSMTPREKVSRRGEESG